MGRVPVRFYSLTLCAFLLAVFAVAGRGQAPVARVSGVVVDYFAPSAIDRGLMPDLSRSPDSPEATIRASVRTANTPIERIGASGARYLAGSLIVKFRDGVSTATRLSALSAMSRSASMSARPSYADFDLVAIDPTEDAEAAAHTLAARADVEYAQPVHRL